MKLQSMRPMIWTNKLDETISFYTDVLGFSIAEKNNDWGWASLFKDGVEMMVAKPNDHTPFERPVFTGSFYFTTDAVDKLWETLRHKAQVCYELETFEWQMREFAIFDNNGYLLQFGQEVTQQ